MDLGARATERAQARDPCIDVDQHLYAGALHMNAFSRIKRKSRMRDRLVVLLKVMIDIKLDVVYNLSTEGCALIARHCWGRIG
jgi:hypothetical protein